ncbi:MAG: NADH-quinone oxidoreductase subunit N [candidate division Zixibacteria bacterium]|nr:NADH-quinone oxidoreductase subunit N [candidate division Zixibacteria bacterium]
MDLSLIDINWQVITPQIILAVFGFVLLLLEAFLPKDKKGILPHLAWIGIALSFFFSVNLFGSGFSGFNGMALADNFALFFSFIFLISSFLVVLLSISFLKREEQVRGDYYALLLFATLGMMLMASSFDLIVIFLGLEIVSVSLYILSGFRKKDPKSNEASMKFFLMGSFATSFLIFGIALIYGNFGTTNLEKILFLAPFSGVFAGASEFLLYAGIGFLIVGFGFKIASVPFHMWMPDVFEGAPTPIAGFISAGPKAAGFAALLRIFLLAFSSIKPDWTLIFWILAVLSMTTGNLLALWQTNLKRLLAYSSIAHGGYILIAFVSGSNSAISGVLFYLSAYILMNLGAFAVIISMGSKEKEGTDLYKEYAGAGLKNPFLGVFMAIFMLSLAGFPPTAGFFAKFYIFSSAIKSGYLGLVIIAVINSLISVYYYLRVIVYMFMRPSAEEVKPVSIPFSLGLVILLTGIGILALGILPQELLNLAYNSIF